MKSRVLPAARLRTQTASATGSNRRRRRSMVLATVIAIAAVAGCARAEVPASAPTTTKAAVAFVPAANAVCREMKKDLVALPRPTAMPLDEAYTTQTATFVDAATPIMQKGRSALAAVSDGSATATAAVAKMDAWLAAVKATPSVPRVLVEPAELQDDALVAGGLTDCFTRVKTFVPVSGPIG